MVPSNIFLANYPWSYDVKLMFQKIRNICLNFHYDLNQVTFVCLHLNKNEWLKIFEFLCFKNSGQNQWGLLIKIKA